MFRKHTEHFRCFSLITIIFDYCSSRTQICTLQMFSFLSVAFSVFSYLSLLLVNLFSLSVSPCPCCLSSSLAAQSVVDHLHENSHLRVPPPPPRCPDRSLTSTYFVTYRCVFCDKQNALLMSQIDCSP